MDSAIGFLYSTLIPAIGLIPIWFSRGRFWMLGENDWVETDHSTNSRALPGLLTFHVLLWCWERQRQQRGRRSRGEGDNDNDNNSNEPVQLPEVALGLWGVYMLHILFQVFYVIIVEDDNNHTDPKKSFCVASKYWHAPLTFCNRMAMGLLIDIWIIMGATLVVSYWTWDEDNNIRPPSTSLQIRYRMTQSLKPSMLYIPLWYALGHLTLGSGGGFLLDDSFWNKNQLILLLEAILVILPFHFMLLKKQHQQPDTTTPPRLISMEMSILLVSYYGLHFLTQFFVAKDNIIQHYLPISTKSISTIALFFKILLLINMVSLLTWSYYEAEAEAEQQQQQQQQQSPAGAAEAGRDTSTTNNNGSGNTSTAGGRHTDETAQAAQTTNNEEEMLRVPLLSSAPEQQQQQQQAEGERDAMQVV